MGKVLIACEDKMNRNEYHREYRRKNKDKINAYQREWNRKGDNPDKRNRQRREWALRQKELGIEYKGGKCVACGYSKCSAALDFHHINPEEKEGLRQDWCFEKNKSELDKCVLLCANCHRELHAGVISI